MEEAKLRPKNAQAQLLLQHVEERALVFLHHEAEAAIDGARAEQPADVGAAQRDEREQRELAVEGLSLWARRAASPRSGWAGAHAPRMRNLSG